MRLFEPLVDFLEVRGDFFLGGIEFRGLDADPVAHFVVLVERDALRLVALGSGFLCRLSPGFGRGAIANRGNTTRQSR